MTPEQFLFLQEQLFLAFGPLIPWLIVALVVGGFLTALMVFSLIFIRGL